MTADLNPEALDQLEALTKGGEYLPTSSILALIAEVREGKLRADLLRAQVAEMEVMLTEADRQLDADRKHAALAEGEFCDICTHREAEEMYDEIERLRATVQRVRDLVQRKAPNVFVAATEVRDALDGDDDA